jgi:hypothetical protein
VTATIHCLQARRGNWSRSRHDQIPHLLPQRRDGSHGGGVPDVAAEAHAVIEQAKAAGVYVFGGGIDEEVGPVLVAPDGTVSTETHPGIDIRGGFTILELPDRAAAQEWARKIAAACRCSQELREFQYDPQS